MNMNLQKPNRMGNVVALHQNTFPFGKNTSSVTISQLVPKMRISRLEVIVLEKDEDYVISKLKTPIYSLYVADQTASVVMAYFGDSARNINIGDVLRLENVTTKLYWNYLQLIVLENSKVRRLGEDMMVFSEFPNMSHMEWVPDESGNPENLKPRPSEVPIKHWMPPQMAKAQENARSITSKFKIRPHRDFDKPMDRDNLRSNSQPSYYPNYVDRPDQRQVNNIPPPLIPGRPQVNYSEFTPNRNDHMMMMNPRNRYDMNDMRNFRNNNNNLINNDGMNNGNNMIKRQKLNGPPMNGMGNNIMGNLNGNRMVTNIYGTVPMNNNNNNNNNNNMGDSNNEGYNSPPPLGPTLI